MKKVILVVLPVVGVLVAAALLHKACASCCGNELEGGCPCRKKKSCCSNEEDCSNKEE